MKAQQGMKLIILFIFGSSLVTGVAGNAKNDAWIAVIIAIIMTIPILLVYSRILTLFPGKDAYDIFIIVFGKVAGRLFVVLYIWFAFHLGALVLRNFGEFISTVALPETPKVVPIIAFGLICIWSTKKGVEAIASSGSYFVIVVIGLLILFGSLTIPKMKMENILPIMYNGAVPILKSAFSAFSFPFAEIVVFLLVFSRFSNKINYYKIFIMGFLIAAIFVLFVSLRNIMVLGPESATVYFPSYSAISRINIGNFLQRLEISVSIVFLLCGFIKICICLYAAANGFAKLMNYDSYRYMVTPIGLLMVNLSMLIYNNIMEMFSWAFNIWPYYSFLFEAILPIIVLISAEIKVRILNKSSLTG